MNKDQAKGLIDEGKAMRKEAAGQPIGNKNGVKKLRK
jgi:hypothetical protein